MPETEIPPAMRGIFIYVYNDTEWTINLLSCDTVDKNIILSKNNTSQGAGSLSENTQPTG